MVTSIGIPLVYASDYGEFFPFIGDRKLLVPMVFLLLLDCSFAYAAISVVEPLFGWFPFLKPIVFFTTLLFYVIYVVFQIMDFTAGRSSHTWRLSEDWHKTYHSPGTVWFEKEYTVPQLA